MLIYVRCPSCGEPIGSVYDAFHAIRTHMLEKELAKLGKVDLTAVSVDEVVQLDLDDIFNKLGLSRERWCCRQRITTNVNMHDM